jgi:hypothetical protein
MPAVEDSGPAGHTGDHLLAGVNHFILGALLPDRLRNRNSCPLANIKYSPDNGSEPGTLRDKADLL